MKSRLGLLAVAMIALTAFAGGCVKKTLTIDSQPQGALVVINECEVGRTPVTVPFVWYGSYEIILSKEGYDTQVIHQRIFAPPHQWLGVDLITEALLPMEFKDEKHFKYTLDKTRPVRRDDLINRGEALQQKALRGG